MRILMLIILLAFPTLAGAITARVQTGEHDSFTRIAIAMRPGSDWSVDQNETELFVKIENVTDFDLRGFFDLIGRDRISGVEMVSGDGRLRISTTCLCNVETFVYKGRFLVVDIGPADIVPDVLVPKRLELPLLGDATPKEPQRLMGPLLPSEKKLNLLTSLEDVIVRGIAGAATQGLLTPAKSVPIQERLEVFPGIEEFPMVSATSSKRNAVKNSGEIAGNNGIVCLPSKYVDVNNWSKADSFADEIALHRPYLLGEFDRPSSNTVIGLAKSYIYFGFGAEAVATLDLLDARSQETDIMRSLAQIIDDMPVNGHDLEEQYSCESPIAIWSLLAKQDQEYNQPLARNSILIELRALPDHLRHLLAPKISERFLNIGDSETAELALGGSLDSTEKIENKAALEIATGDSDQAASRLASLAKADNRVGISTIVGYFDLVVDQQLEVDPSMFEIADVMRFEQRSHPEIEDLIAAQVAGLIHDNRALSAFELANENRSLLDLSRFNELEIKSTLAVTNQLDDAGFVNFVFTRPLADINQNARHSVAARLIELGFPEGALSLLEIERIQPEEVQDALLALAKTKLGAQILDESQPPIANINDQPKTVSVRNAIPPSTDLTALADTSLGLSDPPEIQDMILPLKDGRELVSQSEQVRELLTGVLAQVPAPAFGAAAPPSE